jgi:hypothetical protein
MTTWTFSLVEEELTSPSGRTWKAVSGPRGNGHLEVGKYTIGQATIIGFDARFTDGADNSWWCPIKPKFKTSRSGLGIHPKNKYANGTEGCIGLTANNTKDTFRELKSSVGQELTVVG